MNYILNELLVTMLLEFLSEIVIIAAMVAVAFALFH